MRGVGELIDAGLVASAEEVAREECGDAGLGHFEADQPGAERNGVGVVVLAGERGGDRLSHLSAAARRVTVGGDGNTDTGAANGDSPFGAAVGESLRKKGAVTWIIDALRTIGAKVDDFMPSARNQSASWSFISKPAWSAERAMRMGGS